jgi:hypothetical protein
MDDDMDRYWMPPTGSGKNSGKRVPAMTTSRVRKALDRSNWITKCAQQVLGSYRKDDFADPDSYLVQLGMVLERYDDKVIEAVTSPVTGIQRTCKFPPAIAEVVEFIDEHIRRAGFAANYDARSRKQLEEREKFERQGKTETPEYRKAVVDRAKAEMRARGFQFEGDTKPAERIWKQFSADELLAKYSRRP